MIYNLSASLYNNTFTTEITAGQHSFLTDEPASMGGEDLGPSPHELFIASLLSCKAITMRMYANRKNWDLRKIDLSANLEVQSSVQQQTTFININIVLQGDLNEEQKRRIIAIADRCPIHKIMENPIVINSNLVDM